MTTIQWLHLTDLHLGQSDPRIAWPVVQADFLQDVANVRDASGAAVDLVLFTGDPTYSGGQFSDVTAFLQDVWGAVGGKPALLTIPGNHDVSWPSPDTALLPGFDSWSPEVQSLFWKSADNDFRKLIATAFSAYTNWLATHPLGRVDGSIKSGEIPGDFAVTFSKEGWEIGIVGLNSAFRQLRGGDYRGKLVLHAKQMQSVCGTKYPQWLRSRNLSMLLTHHPPSWLSDESHDVYRAQIATKDYFALHLCGHQHKDQSTWVQEGKHTRRPGLGRSLFGSWGYTDYDSGGAVQKKRLHGYSLMRLELSDGKATFREWPRKLEQTNSGDWEFLPNTDLEGALQADGGTAPRPIPIRPRKAVPTVVSAEAATDSLRLATQATQVLSKTWHGTLRAASAISEGLHGDAETPRHTFELMRYAYRISKEGDQIGTVTYHLRPANGVAGVQLFRHFMSVEANAPAVAFLEDLRFGVRDLDGGLLSVAYLQTLNEPREKKCAIFLLPEVVTGETRRVEVSWLWPSGFAKLLETGEEEISFTVRSAELIAALEIVVESELDQVDFRAVTPSGEGEKPAVASVVTGPTRSALPGNETRWVYRLEGLGNGTATVRLLLPKREI